ncbi:Cyanovirin-N domain protein [Gloeothece citriformis PCC 7424]|uniref:Cyanovirin-N domain protein n=1 Tax=Gloeothece citriformis (strain PCC 7424) TaxID=65393 RepID=B7KAY8_GLOC7|nr:CVNH domain-containing protein [Gloeothece citriformis]ACK70098.1 Cyanovirin-N domain protein [Gloeothece citriformis PCC 7424]
MKKTLPLLRIAFTLLLALCFFLNVVPGKAWATGEFSASCTNVTISHNDDSNPDTIGTPILSASCQNLDGSYVETTLDLNPYIGNGDGILSWAGDKNNFGLSCYDLEISNTGMLTGMCFKDIKRVDGKLVIPNPKEIEASINLNAHIANLDGTLKYE